ncbi:hypothetical protein TELCIR_13738 [Teladorsagia circumcincta]|uniref:Uncharacterized protein n=1 Tax=Teladorsagia circumcincta TaxID=45464 RepID=A0A2G9U301_TELCI|nr:hypothetical protein TELCIR_13738 [Teladorsagia circumcincta]
MVQWRDTKEQCKAGFLRHLVCVLGTEDLLSISNYHHILVNKMMPSFDYGAIACVSELLFNRTYLGQNDHPLNMSIYENLPTVRFHNDLTKNNTDQICQTLRVQLLTDMKLRALVLCLALCAGTWSAGEDDIVDLPGLQFVVNFKTYSGYLNANDKGNWQMHYM